MPQRIRAGCDPLLQTMQNRANALPQRIRAGCDAGPAAQRCEWSPLPQRIRAGCDQAFHPLRRAVLPLPQRIRAGCDATMITATNQFHLCHSAFARVATAGHQRTCGHGLFKVVNNGTRNEGISALAGMEHFASAHSRGLRPIPVQQTRQRVSLPQRIRAGCDTFAVATPSCLSSLPQRIRAGCDASDIADYILSELCHSAFARVATALAAGCRLRYVLCHSAFARVATPPLSVLHCLRASLPQRIRAGCDDAGSRA